MNDVEILATGGYQSRIERRYDLMHVDVLSKLAYPLEFESNTELALWYLHLAASRSLENEPTEVMTTCLRLAFTALAEQLNISSCRVFGVPVSAFRSVAETLYEGSLKYPIKNYLLIPVESHINHALNHLYLHLEGDTSENHLSHALCRIFMATEVLNADS